MTDPIQAYPLNWPDGWPRTESYRRQRAKSKRMQELAALARTGPEGQRQAQKEMRQIDRAPTVFDGAKLEPAVKALIKAVTTDQQPTAPTTEVQK